MRKKKIQRKRKATTLAGLPVRDAKRSITLDIKLADIKGAKSKSPGACAAARAAKRELHTEARVHLGRVYLKRKDHWDRYITPASLRGEILAFDRGGRFEPTEVHLKAPSPSVQLGAPRYRGSGPSGKKRHLSVTANVRSQPDIDKYSD